MLETIDFWLLLIAIMRLALELINFFKPKSEP